MIGNGFVSLPNINPMNYAEAPIKRDIHFAPTRLVDEFKSNRCVESGPKEIQVLQAQVGFLYTGIIQKLFSRAFKNDPTVLQDISILGNGQGLQNFLGHQQHGYAPIVQFLNGLENLRSGDR